MATAGRWEDLQGVQLHSTILNVLNNEFGFSSMTPVQAAAIPPLLSCKDVCVEAETGSGKTLSFLIPIAQLLLFGRRNSATPLADAIRQKRNVRAIVLLPTRELALQVHSVAKQLFAGLPGDVLPVPLIGGALNPNSECGAGPDKAYEEDHRIIIATPGRLSAAVCEGALRVSALDVLIMDEADRLLDMGFAVTVTDILTRLPKQRRTGMYSATQTSEVDALARAGMRNPVRVAVRVQGALSGAESSNLRRPRIPISVQCLYRVISPREKLATLLQLLAQHASSKVIVYFLTCAYVEYFQNLPLESMLMHTIEEMNDEKTKDEVSPSSQAEKRHKFFPLHGKMTQKRRQRNLELFAQCDTGVLLCTDVAARGIDIPDVDWVVQMDIPQDPDAYIHRVGRTGRLGRDGNAVLYIGKWEENYIDFLRVRKCPIREQMPSERETQTQTAICRMVQEEVLKTITGDRAVLDASEKAFLSFVRAYKEHRCQFLLKVKDVDFNSVGDALGLLRLPRFHEFKKVKDKIEPRNKDGIAIRDIAYKDKKREQKRLKDIAEAIANRAQRREMLQAKSKKKKRKKRKTPPTATAADTSKPKGEDNDSDNDYDDFSTEAMQLRKLKRGKLSMLDFDRVTGYDKLELQG